MGFPGDHLWKSPRAENHVRHVGKLFFFNEHALIHPSCTLASSTVTALP